MTPAKNTIYIKLLNSDVPKRLLDCCQTVMAAYFPSCRVCVHPKVLSIDSLDVISRINESSGKKQYQVLDFLKKAKG